MGELNMGELNMEDGEAWQQVQEEYEKAVVKHPGFVSDTPMALVVLMEEVGGVAKVLCDCDFDNLPVEVAQVGAVALRFLELIERQKEM